MCTGDRCNQKILSELITLYNFGEYCDSMYITSVEKNTNKNNWSERCCEVSVSSDVS